VLLEALRRYLPETKEQLHRKMAGYYWQRMKAEQELEDARVESTPEKRCVEGVSKDAYSEWSVEIPEQEFGAWVEYFYHALQVRDLQADAFRAWAALTGQAINRWRRWQAGALLELVRQVAEEGESFLSKASAPYGHYLVWYSRYLGQGAYWEGALGALKQAAKVFEQVGTPADIAGTLNNIGYIYQQQGELEQALRYYERTLILDEQVGDPASIATTLNNIGYVYDAQGELEQALRYYERALTFYEQVGNPASIATILNNIAYVYQQQESVEQAIVYLNRALSLYERLWSGFEADVAEELETLAACYDALGEPEKSTAYTARAQHIRKKIKHTS
jgi:tetratricopeptide (TPR) repeat protein